MSLSEVREPRTVSDLASLTRSLTELCENASARGKQAPLAGELRGVVSAVVRLYALANEGAPDDIEPLEPEVSATDAVVMACALLKARDLNPFDLALWFSRTRTAG